MLLTGRERYHSRGYLFKIKPIDRQIEKIEFSTLKQFKCKNR
jgi:hypothetical protein